MADREYLAEGIRRIQSGEVKGSHAAGVFSRCAADFEKSMRFWFSELVANCDLSYERDVRPHCKDVALDRATLGNVIAGIRRVASLNRAILVERISSDTDLSSVLQRITKVNDSWVRIKHHGEELSVQVMLKAMTHMASVLDDLSI